MLTPPGDDSRFRLTEAVAYELRARFGTPLYVVDEAHLRHRTARFQRALAAEYPQTEISFASKANSALGVLAVAHSMGLTIDVAGEGELRAALKAGIPARDCHFHGNNKLRPELAFALEQGIGQVVIDSTREIQFLAGLPRRDTRFLLRLAPGVDPKTHAKISTGQADSKFGFNVGDGAAEAALLACLAAGIRVVGFHCHVGSQLMDGRSQAEGATTLAEFAVLMRERHGYEAEILNFGGGLGVRYVDEIAQPVEAFCADVVAAFKSVSGVGNPVIGMEPGRWLVAESGVTLYEAGPIKRIVLPSGEKTYVSVDGGLSDNPRPVMYGARYQVETVRRSGAEHRKVTVAGRHCETDTLFEDVALPVDLESGELLQVLTTGAYNASMASNYNRFLRPAMVLLRENGEAFLTQRRETWDDLLVRDQAPSDLIVERSDD